MTFQDFLMNSPDGGLMIKVGDGTPIGGLPPWIASDPVNGGLMFKVNNTGGGGSVNPGVLQVSGGVPLSLSLTNITDQSGNTSTLWLSTTTTELRGVFALNNGTKKVTFDYAGIAATDKTITIPNATGTMALTSDIPSFTGFLKLGAALDGTLRTVTDYATTASKLQLATEKVAFAGFTGAATGDIIWGANGTLTEYTGWNASTGDHRIITKNASPVFFNISWGVNFYNGFSSANGTSLSASGNWNIGAAASPTARVTIKGAGGGANIQDWVNSTNNTYQYITDGGILYSEYFRTASGGYFLFINRGWLDASADGIFRFQDSGGSVANSRINVGGYRVNGTNGVSGTITGASTVTVVNGIITAIV
jgi:hypothetical protein